MNVRFVVFALIHFQDHDALAATETISHADIVELADCWKHVLNSEVLANVKRHIRRVHAVMADDDLVDHLSIPAY